MTGDDRALQWGEHLRNWRKVLNLTARQVAERAGITVDTLRRLEHGSGGVSSTHLIAVLSALGLTDQVTEALDPLSSDLGRARIDRISRQRVRP